MPVTVNSIDERDDARGDERGADVAEQQEQHDDDQQRAFDRFFSTVAMVRSTSVVRS